MIPRVRAAWLELHPEDRRTTGGLPPADPNDPEFVAMLYEVPAPKRERTEGGLPTTGGGFEGWRKQTAEKQIAVNRKDAKSRIRKCAVRWCPEKLGPLNKTRLCHKHRNKYELDAEGRAFPRQRSGAR